MSLYYEYKSCCGFKKEDPKKEDPKKDRDLDCFCGKFPKHLLAQLVRVALTNGTFFDDGTIFRIACIDKHSGIITLVVVTPSADSELDAGDIVYICCKDIAVISPVTPAAA